MNYFLKSLILGIVGYFVIGIIVKYRWKGERGVQTIPNLEFWKSLPGLVKDGCFFTYIKIKELIRRN